jgi:hypothetical protein
MQPYATFYRRHGVRLKDHVVSPPFAAVGDLVLPKESLVHHLGSDGVVLGPEPDDVLFKNHEGRVLVEHVQELSAPVGGPRPDRTTPATTLYRNYHRRYRTMRPLNDFDKSLRDPRTLIVENYAHLSRLWQYMRSIYAGYYKSRNVLKTVIETMNLRCEGNDRQHYLVVEAPKRLPNLAMLKKASAGYKGMPKPLLEVFAKPEQLFLLEMWTWLGETKDQSILSDLKPENYRKINLVYVESGRWFVLNLAALLELFNEGAEEGGEGSTQMQRYFLRMMIAVFEQRTQFVESGNVNEDTDSTTAAEKEPRPMDDASIDADLDQLDQLSEDVVEEDVTRPMADTPSNPTDAILARVAHMAEEGRLSPAQQRRFISMIDKSSNLPNPFGEGTLNDYRQITQKDLELNPELINLPKMAGVTDESMLESTLMAFDSQYVNTILNKDITNAALSLQQAGVIVTDYSVETVEDAANHYQKVTMRVAPVDGEPSTVRFRVPVVDPSGVFISNDVKYRLRKQRSDKPIRKTSPNDVALTSYYAKAFVSRSQKSVVNYPKWLSKKIEIIGMDDDNKVITNLKHSKTFVSEVKLPRVYTILSQTFREFTVSGKYRIFVDYQRRVEEFGEEIINAVETDGFVLVGMQGKTPIVVDDSSTFYSVEGKEYQVLGRIEDLIEIDAAEAPVEIAELRLFSKSPPVGIVLGHRMGLTRLMETLEVTPRRVPVGERVNIGDYEYGIRFADETLIFNKEDQKAQLVLAGFNRYYRTIKRYNVDAFDDPEVYANVMEDNGIRVGYLRELELAMDMFVDPITKDLLIGMSEPTTLQGLLIRSCEMLMIDWHPDETDLEHMRIRGYERIAGAVYSELLRGVRRYRSRGAGSAAKIEMNPEAVWYAINKDSSISQVEESNPIQNLKEKELVTYMGSGGRTTRSMVKHTRAFTKSDMGVISEATVDSQTVGVNAYLSANPQFQNLRGTTDRYEKGKTGSSSLISTSALLSPAVDMDDPKRANFVSIQNSHVVQAEGYRASPLRTGYERMIPHRVDDLFAYTAKQDGEITKKDKYHVTVQYKDGTEVKVELGRRYGKTPGTTIPHDVQCDLEVGNKVKEGDTVSFNSGFFERDPLSPNQVLMRSGIMTRTAIIERSDTWEDASAISEKLAKKLGTRVTKVRTILVSFDQSIRNLVATGTDVDLETILCTIEDSVTADNDLFDEDSLDSLRLMSSNTPKAKVSGQVERVEVFYHGDYEDMSESLLAIAKESDKERVKRLKALSKTPTTGQVDGSVRIDKDPLDMDSMAIKVYITKNLGAGVGDKGVLGNQMKTVFSNVMTGENRTESGVELDVMFSYLSISNRIILSPEVMGTTNTLLRIMSKKVAERYFSKKGQ